MIEGSVERSLTDVLDEVTLAGYTDSFRGEREHIWAIRSGYVHDPEELSIERIERFEGPTDPDEEAILLAIQCRPHGCRGTYILPYGKDMPSADAELVARIHDGRAPQH